MNKLIAPVEKLISICQLNGYFGTGVDFNILGFMGCFVSRGVFSANAIDLYVRHYYASLKNGSLLASSDHLTEITFDASHILNTILDEVAFIDLAKGFFSGNVGIDYIRLVRKDSLNTKPVFLHQDTPYQIGSFEGYSFFVALTDCNYSNGALVIYPGTHHYGYLGDAGEIARVLPSDYPSIETNAQPGDIVIMHSATWHESPANVALTDRVYLEIHIQSADAATTRKVITGVRQTEWQNHLGPDELFLNSRRQRLKSLYNEINNK